jgi:hypothetical protein
VEDADPLAVVVVGAAVDGLVEAGAADWPAPAGAATPFQSPPMISTRSVPRTLESATSWPAPLRYRARKAAFGWADGA